MASPSRGAEAAQAPGAPAMQQAPAETPTPPATAPVSTSPDTTARLEAATADDVERATSAATGGLGPPVTRDAELDGDGAHQWPVAPVMPGPQSTRPPPPASNAPATTRSSPPPASQPPSLDAPAPSDSDGASAATPRAVAPVSAPSSDEAPPTARSQPPESVAGVAPVSVPKQPRLPSESRRGTESSHRGSSALADQSAELQRARQSLAAKDERISKLVAQAETLRTGAEEANARTADKEEELARLRSQHDSLRSLTAVRAERIRELENTHGEQQRRIAELELELREQAQAHEAALINLKAEQELAVAQVKAEQEQAKPPERDDLRAIYGIGPKFEKGLHAAGIHRYRQIAAWTDEDVDAIAATLNVKSARIRKAGWVESAQQLLAERGEDGASTIEGEESDIAW